MLILILFILTLSCIDNAKRAALRSLQPLTWAVLTFVAFFAGIFVTCFGLGLIIMYKNPQLLTLAQTNDRAAMNSFMVRDFAQHETLYACFILAGSMGGYLLIRYILERKPLRQDWDV